MFFFHPSFLPVPYVWMSKVLDLGDAQLAAQLSES